MAVKLDSDQVTRLASLAESRALDPETLVSWIEEALRRTAAASPQPARELSAPERHIIAEEGLADQTASEEPLAASIRGYLRLLDEALDVRAAAERLDVSPSRVRQLLGARRLYGVKAGRDWRLPRWQFRARGAGLVPGIERVSEALPPHLHPLTVEGFVGTPKPELEPAGKPVSPLVWLASGGDPEPVALLAEDL